MQHTSHHLMIEPVNFGFNEATAVNNRFQKKISGDLQQKALEEFNGLVELLQHHNVDVTVVKDTTAPNTPDSIFPNNWISSHDDGSIWLYPMFAVNRRQERKQTVLDALKDKFIVTKTNDLTHYERDALFLEGTGSMVLDRINRVAYACSSPRTNSGLLYEFCRFSDYTALCFAAADQSGMPIYHTNVMMCIGTTFSVICLDAIRNKNERESVVASLNAANKTIIPISPEQMSRFAGNMLEVSTTTGELLLIMSSSAYGSLHPAQLAELEKHNHILHTPLETIETAGGGSARCMMAEIFLTRKPL